MPLPHRAYAGDGPDQQRSLLQEGADLVMVKPGTYLDVIKDAYGAPTYSGQRDMPF